MPYPQADPAIKHTLVGPSPNESRHTKVLSTSSEIFDALSNHIPSSSSPKKISIIYTYNDAPSDPKPLSRTLEVVAYCDVHCSLIRKFCVSPEDEEDNNNSTYMKGCYLGVKRADGEHLKTLKNRPDQIKNSNSFRDFCRALRDENKAGVIGCDSVGRFGIVCPMEYDGDGGCDYAAWCFVGKLDEVRPLFVSTVDDMTASGGDGNTDYGQNINTNSNGLWTPSDTAGNDGSATDLWQPGGEESNSSFGFGDTSSNSLWQPQSSSTVNDHGNDTSALFSTDSTTTTMAGQKRPLADSEHDDETAKTFHANTGAAAADAFYSNLTRSLDTRADSSLFHMRNFNGWVKATQIAELDPRTMSTGSLSSKSSKRSSNTGKKQPLRVLDLACGKGGDLGKWTLHSRGIQNYVGIDVARGSLKDAAIRARKMRKQLSDSKGNAKCVFTCADLGYDVPGRCRNSNSNIDSGKRMQKLSSWSLANENEHYQGEPIFELIRGGGIHQTDKFDVVSIQFAIHYMMSSVKRARRFFNTVSQLLDVGGNLIATTIDSRVVLNHMMGLGNDLHFDDGDNDGDVGSKKSKEELIVVKVGKGACQLKFEPSTVKRIFSPHQQKCEDMISDELFGLEYTFTLVEGEDHAKGVGEAVDLPEWLTPLPVLTALAKEAGLTLEYAQNFHEFYANRKDPVLHPTAHNALYNMKVLNRNGSISEQEWDISRMYMAVKFRKVHESKMVFEDEEDDIDNDEEECAQDSESVPTPTALAPVVEIDMNDPKAKKMYPMAMMKAKKVAGTELWTTMTNEEKGIRTRQELAKMIL